jgi:hypothetical protein
VAGTSEPDADGADGAGGADGADGAACAGGPGVVLAELVPEPEGVTVPAEVQPALSAVAAARVASEANCRMHPFMPDGRTPGR